MIPCETVRERLPAAVLFELTRAELRELHAHLSGCAACLEEEAGLQLALRLLRAHGEEEPVPDLAERLVASTLAAREAGPAAEGGEMGWRPESVGSQRYLLHRTIHPAGLRCGDPRQVVAHSSTQGAGRRREPGRLAAVLLTAAATALLLIGLEAVRDLRPTAAAPTAAAAGVSRSFAAGSEAVGLTPSLLRGTLFDRGRSLALRERTVRERLIRGGER